MYVSSFKYKKYKLPFIAIIKKQKFCKRHYYNFKYFDLKMSENKKSFMVLVKSPKKKKEYYSTILERGLINIILLILFKFK